MDKGDRVTAEILAHGEPKKVNGEIVTVFNGEYDVRPDGFHSLTIRVPTKHVHARKPEEIIKPKLDYKKK